jgi:hypothetical protein
LPCISAAPSILRARSLSSRSNPLVLIIVPFAASGARSARTADASDIGSRHPARYGQNDCENALTRKNALFAGHDDGAENWATLASLIETAKLNGIDPQAWLADILTRLVNLWPNNRLDELLPWTWAAARRLQQAA